MRDETILVWGAGAVGGVVAGYLARAGHNVALVDTDPAHVRSIRRDGLSVTGPEGRFTARPEASLPSDVTGRFKTVILAVKADRTGMAARDLAPALAEDGAVVSFQNGLCEVELADVLGPKRVIGAFINFGADVVGPGQVAMGSRGSVVLGEIDGAIRPRTRTLLTIMQGFEPDARLTVVGDRPSFSDSCLRFMRDAFKAVSIHRDDSHGGLRRQRRWYRQNSLHCSNI